MRMPLPPTRRGISPISSRVPNDNADDEEEDPDGGGGFEKCRNENKTRAASEAEERRDHHSLRPEKVVDILLERAK